MIPKRLMSGIDSSNAWPWALTLGRQNPRAAAQITYDRFPALQEQMTPQLALDSMLQLGCGYYDSYKIGEGYGYSDVENWDAYIQTVYDLGQIETRLDVK